METAIGASRPVRVPSGKPRRKRHHRYFRHREFPRLATARGGRPVFPASARFAAQPGAQYGRRRPGRRPHGTPAGRQHRRAAGTATGRAAPPATNVDRDAVQPPPSTSKPAPNTGAGVEGAAPASPASAAAVDALETTFFPATGDDVVVGDDPYWWQAGDYAQGSRRPGFSAISGVRYTLMIDNNALNGTGHIDLNLSINGTVVGSFSLLPGEISKTVGFFFPPVGGPDYIVRLEETNTVDPGDGSASILLDTSSLTFFDTTTTAFPGTGDTLNVPDNPYWWHAGDYAQGTRTMGLAAVSGVRYDLLIAENALNGTGHVDLDLSINGTVAGSLSILPGEMAKSGIFFFPPVAGPTFTIRLEETNTVDPGAGSVAILLNTSLLGVYGSASSWFYATGDDVVVADDPYWWQAGDYAQGTRAPGLNTVTGVQLELQIDDNALNAGGHVDLDMSINGALAGSFSIVPGETSKTVFFSFPPIDGPIYTVRLEETNTVDPGAGSVAILRDTSALTFYDSSHSAFMPATGDLFDVQSAPHWWNAGDYVQGTRFTGFKSVTGVKYDLLITDNVLTTTGHVDLALSINGIVVDSFTVGPGEQSQSRAVTFAAISGPVYVFRLEETNQVDPGAGSIVISPDLSPIQLSTAIFLPLVERH